MMKQLTYSVFILLSAISCENKTIDHSGHNMNDMEEMDMSAMNHDTSTIESDLYEVTSPVSEVVISNQQTIKPLRMEVGKTISAEGYIAFDERRNNKISARFGGRIVKLYVKYNYQYMKKGDKIMEVYSPELAGIEEEYIYHLTMSGDKNLVQKTKEKLLLLGLTESQITLIEKTGKPLDIISVYSLYEGYVLFDVNENRSGSTESEKKEGMNMGLISDQKNPVMQKDPVSLKEGSYINEGQSLFIINDLKEVWAIVALDPTDELRLKINSQVNIISESPDEPVIGILNFIEPVYKEGQKFTQAKIYLKNDKQHYKINSLVSVEIPEKEKKLSIPSSSILDLGKRKMVWIKTGITKSGSKLFHAKKVIACRDVNGFTEIISGITEKDELAKDAGYMIDSESLIKTN